MTLPTWMRRALLATAVMNIGAAIAFFPAVHGLRSLAGFPEDGPPIYLATVSLFVLLFGLGYLWVGLSGRDERLFLSMAAAGKISFVALLVAYWLAGDLPVGAPLAALGDLFFGVLFLKWLLVG